MAPRTRQKEISSISSEDPGEEDAREADKQVFLCPKEGCTRAFQRHSSLWKDTLHLEHAARQSREKLYSTWQS